MWKIIQTGKLCESCATELRKEIDLHEKEEQRKEELLKQNQRTYLSKKINCLKQREIFLMRCPFLNA